MMRHRVNGLVLFLAGALGCGGCEPEIPVDPEILARLPDEVDYNFHIKPLLSDRCYACHGPDEGARKAGLRLYTEDGAKEAPLETAGRAIVEGSLRRSAVFDRIFSADPDHVMPPPESNLALSDYEKALLARWIELGAVWKPHWAFLPPEAPAVPAVSDEAWPRNDLDRFVLARLDAEGLTPSPEVDRERLLRRVAMDLTGLPPTLDEIDAFLADESPDAYEKVVDRLLAADAYGERMAMEWMDLARYADSHGYHADGYRMMWPWRDWVIQAYNDNMPFDRFITWQLAGDLLPEATHEQKLATAFNRNHQMTAEGGVIDEEYRMEYVIDRTNTTARAFLGLTMECARCHDHKFDPISQKEYYQLAAFYNNVNELGMTGDDGNAGPMLLLADDSTRHRIAFLRAQISGLERRLEQRRGAVLAEGLHRTLRRAELDPSAGLADHYPLDQVEEKTTPNAARPAEAAGVSGTPEVVPGPSGSALAFDYDYDFLSLNGAGLFERTDSFSIGLWVYPERAGAYAELLGNAHHKNTYWRGHEFFLDSLNHASVRLIHARPDNYIQVATRDTIPRFAWTHVLFTYDGSSRASGITLYLNGKRVPAEVAFDDLSKSILPVNGRYEPEERAMRVARSYRAFGGDDGIFRGRLDDIRLYDRKLTAAEVAVVYGENPLAEALAREPGARTEEQDTLLLEYFLQYRDADYEALSTELARLRVQEHALVDTIPGIMVMEEMERPRATYVLDRGLYNAPRERVEPGALAVLGGFPEDLPRNRLGLARWLVDPGNPLTARVTVNRFWQQYFGQGLVVTPEDFGSQGALPSHPALLDWLATTFVASGWDVKALQRLIATSATYRQDSQASPELRSRDPANELLARGPSHRLPAEMIRDNALAASGLLVHKVGGPSVKPYQPPGLWIEKGNFSQFLLNYVPDTGEGLYRRSLYTFIKRTSPPPAMTAFDATDRSGCVVRRQNTNTPMQALILMNDPQYVEAARILAERLIREGGDTLEERLSRGFRLATGRRPGPGEVALLAGLYRQELQGFAAAPARADSLLQVGDAPRDADLDKTEAAALAVVASLMLNHDEAYTKR